MNVKFKTFSFSPTYYLFCTRHASTLKVVAGGCPAEGSKKKEEVQEEEDEEDSPVECSGGETKQLAFIPGEVSGPIPFL